MSGAMICKVCGEKLKLLLTSYYCDNEDCGNTANPSTDWNSVGVKRGDTLDELREKFHRAWFKKQFFRADKISRLSYLW